jgi:serine/threonine protein kinase
MFCVKNKDDIDIGKNIERKEPVMEIDSINEIEPLEKEPIEKNPIENKPEEEEIPIPEPIILSKAQYNSNPLEEYKIISDDSPNSKIISLIDNPEITRLMIIIPNKENICDKEKNKSFMDKVENLQSLEHSHISKIYELYIYDYNYYLICEYIKEKNLEEKISSGTLDESVIKTIMEQIFNSIIYLHKENIFNIGLKLDEIILIETSIKPAKKKY